jgi:hypothetical protein
MEQMIVAERLHEVDAVVKAHLPASTAELQAALEEAGCSSTKSAVQLSLQRLRTSGFIIEKQDGAYHARQTLEEYTVLKHEARRVRDLDTRLSTTAGMYPTEARLEAMRLMHAERETLDLDVKHKQREYTLEKRIARDQAELAELRT